MRLRFLLIRILMVAAQIFCLAWAYVKFVQLMNQVIDLHMQILNLMWGVMGVCYCKFATDILKNTLNAAIKFTELWYIANEDNDIKHSFNEVLKIFGRVGAVFACAKILSEIVESIKDKIELPEFLKSFVESAQDETQKSFIGRLAKAQLDLVISNLDECALVIAFKTGDRSFLEALKIGFNSIVKNSLGLVKTSFNVQILLKASLVFFDVCYVAVLFNTWQWSATYCARAAVIFFLARYALQFAIFEPLTYTMFTQYISTNMKDDESESIDIEIPGFDKLASLIKEN